MSKKIKKVADRRDDYLSVGSYDYDGLGHWWAYNSGYKSTAGDRMSVRHECGYSYSTIICKMFETPKESHHYRPLVLLTSRSYSPTTQKHLGAFRSSTSHFLQISVPNVTPTNKRDHSENMDHFLSEASESINKYQRARAEHVKDGYIRRFHKATRGADDYASYFKLKRDATYKSIMKLSPPGSDGCIESLADIEDKIQKSLEAQRKKEVKARIKQDKEHADKAKVDLKEWLNGADKIPNGRYLESVHIRIKGAVVETTERGTIALKACLSAFKKHNNGTLKVGDEISGYRFGGVHDNIAKIGCHNVPMKLIENLLNKEERCIF